jgi:hypothetical protein
MEAASEELRERSRRLAQLLESRRVSREELELAAYLGDAGALAVVGEVSGDPVADIRRENTWDPQAGDFVDLPWEGDELRAWVEGLGRWGSRAYVQAAVIAGRWTLDRVSQRIDALAAEERTPLSLELTPQVLGGAQHTLAALCSYLAGPRLAESQRLEDLRPRPSGLVRDGGDDALVLAREALRVLQYAVLAAMGDSGWAISYRRPGHDPEQAHRWGPAVIAAEAVVVARVGLRPGESESDLRNAIRAGLLPAALRPS